MTKEEFLTRARETHGYKYEYPNLPDKVLSNQTINIIFNGVLYKQRVVKHILLKRCPEKNTLKFTQNEFIQKSKDIWGEKYDYSLTQYNGASKYVKIIYDGIIFEQNARSHMSGMAPELLMNQDYFIKKSKDKWGDKYNYSLVEYKNCKTKVKILFNDKIYEQTPAQHLICAPENIILSIRKTTEQFIKEANEVHDNKFTYEKTNYIKNQIKVIITCPIHGDFEQNPLSHIQGNGCSNCNESRGEREIVKFLKKYNLNFERQKKFEKCKNIFQLPFDFYIPSMNTLIEFDGPQHYSPMDFFGGLDAYEKLKINDSIKTRFCEDNYINLIRIRYDQIDDIYSILWNNLSTFIKLRNKK